MIDRAALLADQEREQDRVAWWRRSWLPAAVAAVTLAVVALALVGWIVVNRPPGEDSAEAGFARDMIVHHDQAVAMALAIRDRTSNPTLKVLATDIMLTQENQMGQMLGWLNVWGLPATGLAPHMAWMGHPTPGLMPGMATPEELAHLDQLTGTAADDEFLRLMILHHQSGIAMAEAVLERSGNEQVRDLATSIVTSQTSEIAAMQDLLEGWLRCPRLRHHLREAVECKPIPSRSRSVSANDAGSSNDSRWVKSVVAGRAARISSSMASRS